MASFTKKTWENTCYKEVEFNVGNTNVETKYKIS
jgi:hypothetical protein